MESRHRVLLLSGALGCVLLSGCASIRDWLDRDEPRAEPAQEQEAPAGDPADQPAPRVIDPEVERRRVKVAKIDTENVELGLHFGALSVEDFGTNPVYGFNAAFHVTEDLFFQVDWGRSTAGRSSVETFGEGVQLLTGGERRLRYYSLSLGYNFLPGEVFLGRDVAMNSTFYLLGGIGATKFAGDERFTVNFGAGYRILPTDWLAIHVDVQDRLFESDLFDTSEMAHNIEARIGATVFF